MDREVDKIPITEETPQYKRITWWLENTWIRGAKRIINAVSRPIRQILSFSATDFIEDIESELIPIVKPFANDILAIPGIPSSMRSAIEKAISGKSPAALVVIGAILVALGETMKMGFSGPLGRKMEAQVDYVFRSRLFDPGTLVELKNRGIITEGETRRLMAFNGLTDDSITALMQLGIPLLDDTTLTQLMWRKEIGDSALSHELSKRGMNQAQIMLWKQIREVIPSPSELISIAVREGFNDSVAARFGYDEDYPTVAADYAEKQGMRPLFFKAAWRAHWNLPGLVQVRDMYHRDIINDEDVRVYLKAADLPIFWRNALIKWMDRIVTRVDARRMYSLGIWDDARVFEHHKQLGYNDQDATDMTMWTALNYMENDRELTKTDILSMYQDGILNVLEATSYLEALDYRPQAIGLLLAHRDLKREEQYERQVIGNVKALFVGGLYDRTDVFAQLGKLATPDAVIKQNLAVWDLEKERRVKVPTVVQLKDMVLDEVITVDTFRQEMTNKKYPIKYINWYITLWFKE